MTRHKLDLLILVLLSVFCLHHHQFLIAPNLTFITKTKHGYFSTMYVQSSHVFNPLDPSCHSHTLPPPFLKSFSSRDLLKILSRSPSHTYFFPCLHFCIKHRQHPYTRLRHGRLPDDRYYYMAEQISIQEYHTYWRCMYGCYEGG